MYEQVLSRKDAEWFVYGTKGADFTVIGSCPLAEAREHHECFPLADGEVLGSSEWVRVEAEDLAIMSAAPLALQLVELIRAKDGAIDYIDLVDFCERFEAKVEESLRILAAEQAAVDARRSPQDPVVAERPANPLRQVHFPPQEGPAPELPDEKTGGGGC